MLKKQCDRRVTEKGKGSCREKTKMPRFKGQRGQEDPTGEIELETKCRDSVSQGAQHYVTLFSLCV